MTILPSGLRDLAPERLAALRHVTTIEGPRLSGQQVELLLQGLDTNAFRSRDEDEFAEYAEAMQTIFESWDAIPLTAAQHSGRVDCQRLV